MIDTERIGIDVNNLVDRLWLDINRLERAAKMDLPEEQKIKVARAINIFASRTKGLAVKAQKLSFVYQR